MMPSTFAITEVGPAPDRPSSHPPDMRIAIMQPYVFPYLGYFQLLHAADRFLLFDDVNFIKKGWINRNRILLQGEPYTFTIPIQDVSQNRTIKDSMISPDPAWKQKLLANIRHAYLKAPLFNEVYPSIEEMIGKAEGSIAGLAERSIRWAAERLSLTATIQRTSDLAIAPTIKGQERILAICSQLGASMYINPANGAELYDADAFASHGVALRFLRMDADVQYDQVGSDRHVPALSIIDVLMNCTQEQVLASMARYRIFEAPEAGPSAPTPVA
jgi:hypothetical protein